MTEWIQNSLYLIPLLPLLGALINGLLGRRLGKGAVTFVALGSVLASAVLAALVLVRLSFAVDGEPAMSLSSTLGTWFSVGGLDVRASLYVDRLNGVLAMVVTGVGFLIHVYSTEYMKEDPGYARYFAYLNLFVGFMLILVLANSLVLMFVGWEGVGLCSYLLIGFWYEDDAKALAGRKAFVVNRIGDFGFLLGIFTLFALFGTTEIQQLAPEAKGILPQVRNFAAGFNPDMPVLMGPLSQLGVTWGQAVTFAALMLFVGATGKSAQLPLYVWLPDAMAGPTPVSALIHAATMVTAGVYMIARLSFFYALTPTAMAVVAVVGAATALFAALMGFAQNDIKKVLAYSTVSQLGFMVMGVGIGAYWAATFHLVTHAFFKALLFLGAGSVILGCHHEQDIRQMGGLRRRMPSTWLTFLIGTIAITGVLPLSGFFSKDAILHFAHGAKLHGHAWVGPAIYWVGTLAALGTAFYMFRLYFLVFHGEPRSEQASHAHESHAPVTVPLWILGLLSAGALVWGLPIVGEHHETPFQNFTNPVFALAHRILAMEVDHGGLLVAFAIALAVAWVGFLLAFALYARGGIARLAPSLKSGAGGFVYRVVANKFYVDELYDAAVVGPFKQLSYWLWRVVDVFAIDTLVVRGTAYLSRWGGEALRLLQNGDVQRYAAVMAIAAVAAIWALTT